MKAVLLGGSMNKTMKWFFRLLVYPFILFKASSDADASEREIFSNALPAAIGLTTLMVLFFVVSLWIGGKVSNESATLLCCGFIAIYLAIGTISFFTEKNSSNDDIPWQDNGRW